MTTAAYDELARHWQRLHRFGHLSSMASWDRAAMMPSKGNEARAQALAEMDALLHSLATEPRLAALVDRAGQEPLDDLERANLREIRRDWRASNALPMPALAPNACSGRAPALRIQRPQTHFMLKRSPHLSR